MGVAFPHIQSNAHHQCQMPVLGWPFWRQLWPYAVLMLQKLILSSKLCVATTLAFSLAPTITLCYLKSLISLLWLVCAFSQLKFTIRCVGVVGHFPIEVTGSCCFLRAATTLCGFSLLFPAGCQHSVWILVSFLSSHHHVIIWYATETCLPGPFNNSYFSILLSRLG